MENLKTKLRQFKLAGIVKSLEIRNKFAIDNNISYLEFMELLMDDELVNRKANSFGKRLIKSKIITMKSIDEFDFNYQPKLNKKHILDLASCRFINENKNIVLMGKPGVGKTHLANALGLEALKQGYNVLFLHINDLIDKLNTAKADGSYIKELARVERQHLLIIDDFGLQPLDAQSRSTLMEIIEDRHGKASTIITSQIPVSLWHEVIGEQTIADAILDRLVHDAHRLDMKGESMRRKKDNLSDSITDLEKNKN